MNDGLVRTTSSGGSAPRGRRYRRHALDLADGGRLVLGVDGVIDQLDAHGAKTHSWRPDDPAWPDHALRFGLHPETPTVAPPGRRIQGTKPAQD
jgi:hypothetical protein